MVFGWFKRFRAQKARAAGADRADRNAVIRRIVSAAAAEGRKREDARAADPPPAIDPPRTTADGRPIIPLPAGKPPTPPPMPSPLAAAPPELMAGPPVDGEIPQEKVAQRAFEIWVRKGRPVGTADQDWVQAEAELRVELLYRPVDPAPPSDNPR